VKKLLIVLAVVLVAFAGAVVFGLANLNSYLNENREWVASHAGSALGRSVSFGQIGISFTGGLGVRVEKLRIDDDPAFSRDPFVTAGAVDLRVALWPALFGNIEVGHIILRSPAITVVQTAKGLNTSTIGSGKKPVEEAPAEGGLPAFLVRTIEVSDGTLRFINKTASPPAETVVAHLDFTASNVSLTGPIPFDVKAAVLGAAEQNVRIAGTVRDLQSPNAEFTLTSSKLELPASKQGATPDSLHDLEIKGQVAVPQAGPKVKGALRSPSGTVGGFNYGDLSVDFGFQNQVATIEKLSIGLFGGTLGASGRYDMTRAEQPRFDLNTTLASMQLGKFATSLSPKAEGAMEGQIGGGLSLVGTGTTWTGIRPSLTGNGDLLLAAGRIRDVNLADAALQGITGVPGLSNLLPPELRQKYPQVFGSGDTVFENFDAKVAIRDGAMTFPRFNLAALDYGLTGEGTYALDNRLDLSTVMTFSRALSDELVKTAEPIGYLRDAEGRVAIPVKLLGALPTIKPVPDVTYIAKAASRQAVGKLLDKALGTQGQEAPAAQGTGEPPPASSPADLIRKGLGGLLNNPQ
jgi:uncharacterized protein involved in outer membrane biogenesis